MTNLEELLLTLSESRQLEVKSWIDPKVTHEELKIIKALLALYNENGGWLVIGFDNTSFKPDMERPKQPIREMYHNDVIQRIVSKHSAVRFEVTVEFPMLDGMEYPVITVPSGFKTPTLVKADVFDADNKKIKLPAKTLLARSLEESGVISTIPATQADLERIIGHCFDNREADFAKTLSRMLNKQERAILASLATDQSTPETISALKVLEAGYSRFLEAAKKDSSYQSDYFGTWEVAVQITPTIKGHLANKEFLKTLMSDRPRWTGWGIWLDTQYFEDKEARPHTLDGGWQAWVDYYDFEEAHIKSGHVNHFDFWRIEPHGTFYQLRALDDDSRPLLVNRKTVLDWRLLTLRVGEAINTALVLAKNIGATENTLSFAFRFQGLKGRKLHLWANHSGAYFTTRGETTRENTVVAHCEINADAAINQVYTATHQIMQSLLAAFNGESMTLEQVQHEIESLIKKRIDDS